MNKNEEYILQIEAQGNDGEGIARPNGFPVFIRGTVAGDKIRAVITKVKKNYSYGRLLEVIEPSPDRIDALCPLAGRCGGCQLQSMSYEAQLKFKEKKVFDALNRIGGLSEALLKSVAEPIDGMEQPVRYRNKAQFPVGRSKDGRIFAGFYAVHSHNIVECRDCLLSPPEFGKLVRIVLGFMEKHGIDPYDEFSGRGTIRHILIRKGFGTGEIMVCLVVNGNDIPYKEELGRMLSEAESGVSSVVININKNNTNVIMGEKTKVICGKDHIVDELCGLKFRISANAFYQVNPVQAAAIYEKAMEYADVSADSEVWDICSGIGTITLLLAKHAGKACGVEIIPDAVRDAVANAAFNGITNAEFICEDITKYVRSFEDGKYPSPEVVVVDPPRKGLSPEVLDAVAAMQPDRIVYVSCDPATLARDVKILISKGYELKKYKPYDQFCFSGHVETVISLSRV